MHRSARDSDTRSLLDILKAMDQDISPALYKFYFALGYLSSNIMYSRSHDFQHEMGHLW